MITYKQFLETTKFPSEEKFDKIIKKLPSFDELNPNSVQFDPEYDDLEEWLFTNGFLYSLNINNDLDDFNFDSKEVIIEEIESLEILNKLNEKLTSAGWTLSNYEEEKENLEELNEDRNKYLWWYKHRDEISLEDLEKLIK
jgi:hypothetical protein